MVAPAVLDHGTDELKERYLARHLPRRALCCQLLSEPEAGSDLAGLKTRAVRDGDEWVVNGQKVWNSYAHVADVGQLHRPHRPDVPKHQGLTMFLLPHGHAGRRGPPAAPDDRRGPLQRGLPRPTCGCPTPTASATPGGGWRAVLTTLMNERHVVAGGGGSRASPATQLIELATPRSGGPTTRSCASSWPRSTRTTACCSSSPARRGRRGRRQERGRRGLDRQAHLQRQPARIGDVAGSLLGPGVHRRHRRVGHVTRGRRFLCSSPGLRIAGGTDEIQRNTLSERALGLPKEPK